MRIDVYRASGAGGQHVNKTESAVRITYSNQYCDAMPRMTVLSIKIKTSYGASLEKRSYTNWKCKRKMQTSKRWREQSDIGWGSEIRSYVLDDEQLKIYVLVWKMRRPSRTGW
ncbi:peptide chain release factor-like protein [Shigella boydii]